MMEKFLIRKAYIVPYIFYLHFVRYNYKQFTEPASPNVLIYFVELVRIFNMFISLLFCAHCK